MRESQSPTVAKSGARHGTCGNVNSIRIVARLVRRFDSNCAYRICLVVKFRSQVCCRRVTKPRKMDVRYGRMFVVPIVCMHMQCRHLSYQMARNEQQCQTSTHDSTFRGRCIITTDSPVNITGNLVPGCPNIGR